MKENKNDYLKSSCRLTKIIVELREDNTIFVMEMYKLND